MTKKGARELVLHLAKWYPKQFPARMEREDVESRAEDFYEVFDGYDNETIMAACRSLLKTLNFCPTVAEICEAAEHIKAEQQQAAAPNDFWDEDGYHYKRIDGHMVCVERPRRTPLKDPELQAFLDEKRRIYAEVGAPKTYTMRQVRELARQKGIELEEQEDMAVLARLTGGTR